jgi:site-specific DNA-methyltransferase (adenine-specific)
MSAILLRLEFPRRKPNRFIRFNFRERHAVCVTLRRCGVWGRWGGWGVANPNKLYFGDNLDVLREYVADESVDLIYLDLPFNSQAQYNVLFRSPKDDAESAQAQAFRDMWTWSDEAEWAFKEVMRQGGGSARFIDALRSALNESDMMAYLVMMAVRLHELHRKLKPTGSLYLHCDPTASHYLKIVLDGAFGPSAFASEVIWKRTGAHGSAKRWAPVHDTILMYTKTDRFRWNRIVQPYEPGYLEEKYRGRDERGSFQDVSATGAGTRTGASGSPWRGRDPTRKGRHWAIPDAIGEHLSGFAEMAPKEKLDALDSAGELYWPQSRDAEQGLPRIKQRPGKGIPIQDCITDIPALNSQAQERIGYPTQKPLALLDRIVSASSGPGDVVLDPFCGCGTTIESAQRADRQWIGIDIAVHAVKVIEARLADRLGYVAYEIEGMPRDFESAVKLAERDKYQFQWWANYLFNPHALREQKKGADRGIDGELFFPNGPGRPWGRMLTSVKGGEQVGPGVVREFARVLDREKAELGLFICLYPPTREMIREAASVGFANVVHGDIPKLQIVAIEEWFKGKMPLLPPLEHLPSAAFAGRRRPAATTKRPDIEQPELPFTFVGGKAQKGVTRHFNPRMVRGAAG